MNTLELNHRGFRVVQGSQAFTLVELIVVIVVLAITVSFVLPQFGHIVPTGSVQESTRRLSAFFSQVSRTARSRSEPYRVRYSSLSRTFSMVPETDDNEFEADTDVSMSVPELELNRYVTIRDVQLYHGETLSQGTFFLQVDQRGYLQPAFIHLQEESGRELTLQLDPFLGAVRIRDGYVPLRKELFH